MKLFLYAWCPLDMIDHDRNLGRFVTGPTFSRTWKHGNVYFGIVLMRTLVWKQSAVNV